MPVNKKKSNTKDLSKYNKEEELVGNESQPSDAENDIQLSDQKQSKTNTVDERFTKKFDSDDEGSQDEDDNDDLDDDNDDNELNELDDETFKEEVQIRQGQADHVFDNLKPLTDEEINEFNKKVNNTGVLYISRVPPYMRPQKIRHLLSAFGTIGRIYLVREDESIHRRRVKSGGNRKILYTEGWVEFMNKKEAKRCAALLNGNNVGGKKSGFFHDDLWTLKYLKGFKWHHLTEKLSYERRIRMDRLKNEFSQAKKADELYLEAVEKSKSRKRYEEKQAAKRTQDGDEDEHEDEHQVKKPYINIKQKQSVNDNND